MMLRTAAVFVVLVSSLLAFQEDELTIEIRASVKETSPGDRFEIVVVRSWIDGLDVEPFAPESLAPLTLRRTSHRVEKSAGRTRETSAFDAWAFTREDVLIRSPVTRAKVPDDGAPRAAFADDLALAIRPRVDAKNPGTIEPPRPIGDAPIDRGRLIAVAILVLAAAGGVLRAVASRFRRRRAVDRPAHLRAALADLRSGAANLSPIERIARASDLVREALDVGRGIRAPWMTTPEFLRADAAIRRLAPKDKEALGRFLSEADRAKFAAEATGDASHHSVVTEAERFVARALDAGGRE